MHGRMYVCAYHANVCIYVHVCVDVGMRWMRVHARASTTVWLRWGCGLAIILCCCSSQTSCSRSRAATLAPLCIHVHVPPSSGAPGFAIVLHIVSWVRWEFGIQPARVEDVAALVRATVSALEPGDPAPTEEALRATTVPAASPASARPRAGWGDRVRVLCASETAAACSALQEQLGADHFAVYVVFVNG